MLYVLYCCLDYLEQLYRALYYSSARSALDRDDLNVQVLGLVNVFQLRDGHIKAK